MYKHCTTEESALRQRQLEGCLLELMKTESYQQITIGHICDRAGISRKSFYRYFDSKDGCLCALMDHSIIDGASFYLNDQANLNSELRIYTRFFEYWKQMSPLLDVLQKNNLSMQLVERMMVYISEEEHEFRHYMSGNTADSYEQVLFMVSGSMGLVINWHHGGFRKSASQMASILERLLSKN